MLTKNWFLLIGLLLGWNSVAFAQSKKITPTDYIVIEGKVKEQVLVKLKDIESLHELHADSIEIFNHQMEKRSTLRNVQGVLLKDVIEKATIVVENPKFLSEYYFTCIASDGYKVVFSWNELFNNEMGEFVLIITQKNGVGISEDTERIALVAPSDMATGRRYVKGLQRIIVNRVE